MTEREARYRSGAAVQLGHPKSYVLNRRCFGRRCLVLVDGGAWYWLPHLVRHSPTGFEWGYAGSGPADLARSIAGDHMGVDDPSPLIYQTVKDELVAPLPQEGSFIPVRAVDDIVNRILLERTRAMRGGTGQ